MAIETQWLYYTEWEICASFPEAVKSLNFMGLRNAVVEDFKVSGHSYD